MPQLQADIVAALQWLCPYLALCILVPPMFRKRPRARRTGELPANGSAPAAGTPGAAAPSEVVRSVETSHDIVAALLNASKRGVRVRVLCIRAKMALSRTSRILLAPFRYLM